jgi:uncharacterized membrane protein
MTVNKKYDIKKVGEVENVEKLAALRHSRNINEVHEKSLSLGEKIADGMADFAGSWTFIISFMTILMLWILTNSVQLFFHPFDPFPFILLNLVLSCIAAMQAPIIMMSQNRQEKKDRIRAELDYEINLKAEILIEEIIKRLNNLDEANKTISRNQQELLKLVSKTVKESGSVIE